MNRITIKYAAIDGYRETRHFKTLIGAQRYANKMLGIPEFGNHYAISGDGIGKITATVDLRELFPNVQP
jgi:hypothetical protein